MITTELFLDQEYKNDCEHKINLYNVIKGIPNAQIKNLEVNISDLTLQTKKQIATGITKVFKTASES